jgi:hypothetical protein
MEIIKILLREISSHISYVMYHLRTNLHCVPILYHIWNLRVNLSPCLPRSFQNLKYATILQIVQIVPNKRGKECGFDSVSKTLFICCILHATKNYCMWCMSFRTLHSHNTGVRQLSNMLVVWLGLKWSNWTTVNMMRSACGTGFLKWRTHHLNKIQNLVCSPSATLT